MEFGPYQLIRRIAVGGVADVYLAKATGIGGFEKQVAIEVAHPRYDALEPAIQMLIDEAKLAAQVDHRNIIQTYDLGQIGKRVYVVREYVDGVGLSQFMDRAARTAIELPLAACAFIAKEICCALDHLQLRWGAHGKPLIHRNMVYSVLISYTGEVKLIDFCIANPSAGEWRAAKGSSPGNSHPGFKLASSEPADSGSDLYSVGVLLYDLLTGESQLDRESAEAAIAAPTTLRPDIPPELELIVARALAKTASERYPTAGEMVRDLELFLGRCPEPFGVGQLLDLMQCVLGDATQIDAAPAKAIDAAGAKAIDAAGAKAIDAAGAKAIDAAGAKAIDAAGAKAIDAAGAKAIDAAGDREPTEPTNMTTYIDTEPLHALSPRPIQAAKTGPRRIGTRDPDSTTQVVPELQMQRVGSASALFPAAPPQSYFQRPVRLSRLPPPHAYTQNRVIARRMPQRRPNLWSTLLLVVIMFALATAISYGISSQMMPELDVVH